jgi:hypothetical protein
MGDAEPARNIGRPRLALALEQVRDQFDIVFIAARLIAPIAFYRSGALGSLPPEACPSTSSANRIWTLDPYFAS